MRGARRAAVAFALVGTLAAVADAKAVPLPEPMPTVVRGPCPGSEPFWGDFGCAVPGVPFTIYLAKRDRMTYWHELGHVFDSQHMTDGARGRFVRIMGYRPRPWLAWGRDRSLDDSSYDERFAVAYSACAIRPNWQPRARLAWWSPDGYGYTVTPAQHRKVCALIEGVR